MKFLLRFTAAIGLLQTVALTAERGPAWKRHTIDDSSRGADGARLMDVNGDGLLDIATAWEEGGKIRVYLHPGRSKVRAKWPAVTVGEVRSPEDAVFVDLDNDGAIDVVSSCEGRVRTMYVHWAPKDPAKYLDPKAWRTEPLPASQGKAMWMFCLPLQLDGQGGVDLVASSKGSGARVGWFQSPASARNLPQWKWRGKFVAGWIMSLIAKDMDGDGNLDVVVSNRKGPNRGCVWLKNPGPKFVTSPNPFIVLPIGGAGKQVMFLNVADLDRDGLEDVVTAVSGGDLLLFRRLSKTGRDWKTFPITAPTNAGSGKSVRVGDVNLDGRPDLVYSCEKASGKKSGVVWMSYRKGPTDRNWDVHEISGPEGVKFDLLQLIDLDGDGDLDVITCEERLNLGVIWYENPTRKPAARPSPDS